MKLLVLWLKIHKMSVFKNIKKAAASMVPSPIQIDFKKTVISYLKLSRLTFQTTHKLLLNI